MLRRIACFFGGHRRNVLFYERRGRHTIAGYKCRCGRMTKAHEPIQFPRPR